MKEEEQKLLCRECLKDYPIFKYTEKEFSGGCDNCGVISGHLHLTL